MAMDRGRKARDTARRLALQDLSQMYPGAFRALYEAHLVEVRANGGLTPDHLRQDRNANRGADGRFLMPGVDAGVAS